MPLLFVVQASRRALFAALRRLVARPGLVGVMLERRQGERRRRLRPIGFEDRRALAMRQPLDGDSARMWTELGFIVVKVHTLPDDTAAAPRARRRVPRPSAPRPRPPR